MKVLMLSRGLPHRPTRTPQQSLRLILTYQNARADFGYPGSRDSRTEADPTIHGVDVLGAVQWWDVYTEHP